MDIFDTKISCNRCNVQMNKMEMEKNGIKVRAVECPKCRERIVHPEDKKNLEHFRDLKGKTYSVKLRVVGNSHTVSIPKEIVDFMNGMNRDHDELHKRMRRQFEEMDNMVKLCFEDFGRISLNFGNIHDQEEENLNSHEDNEKEDSDELRRIVLRKVKSNHERRENERRKKIENEKRR